MRVVRLNTSDAAAVGAVVDILGAAHAEDFPNDPKFCPEWTAATVRVPVPGIRQERWLAMDSGAPVGALLVEFPELDNQSTALVEVTVHPSARRRGVGTALAEHALSRAVAGARELMIAESVVGGATEAFARAHGAEARQVEHRQRLVVEQGARAGWERLLADAYRHSGGYRLVRWSGPVPGEHLDGMAYLTARMSTDIPLGTLDWQPERWDTDRMRAHDDVVARRGGRTYTTAAVHEASGEVVAFTTLMYTPDDPTHAWQDNTIVEPAHRGHRLGTVVKIENLRFAIGHEPLTRAVTTWNALDNGPMNAINAALGFVPIDHWGEWQLGVG